MVLSKEANYIFETISNKYPFISQEKMIELKDMALKNTNYEAEFGNIDFNLTFRRMLIKEIRSFIRELLMSNDYSTVSEIMTNLISISIKDSEESSSDLINLNIFTSELSLLCDTVTEQQISILLTNIFFTDLLDRVLIDNISIIRCVGFDSIKGNDLTKLILKKYYNICYGDDAKKEESNSAVQKHTNMKEGKEKMKKKVKTLREFLKKKGYSDSQIDDVFLRVPGSYKDFITNKFGSDWDDPIAREWSSSAESNYYYTVIVKNMMRMIDDPSFKPRPKKSDDLVEKSDDLVEKSDSIKTYENFEEVSSDQAIIIESDSFKMLHLTTFEDFLMRDCPFECICLAALRYGGIDGVPRTASDIVKFLNITGGEIGNKIRDVISKYRVLIDNELDTFKSEIYNLPTVEEVKQEQLTDLKGYLRTTSLKQAVFVGLSMGYVNGVEMESKDISSFFGISEKDVQSTIRQSLTGYKEYVSNLVNQKVLSIGKLKIDSNKKV